MLERRASARSAGDDGRRHHVCFCVLCTPTFWKEERQGSAGEWRGGVSPRPGCTPDAASGEAMQDTTASTAVTVSSAAAPSRSLTKCISLDGDSSSGDDGTYQSPGPSVNASPPDGCRAVFRHRHHMTAVSSTPPARLPPGFQSPPSFCSGLSAATPCR